jgi:hypothetical protein
MLNMSIAAIASRDAARSLAHSALPWAPVVPDPEPAEVRPRVYRTRAALSAHLARIADAVAPQGWAPQRHTASSR